MSWTSVTFGRYKGKTLPQIVVLDPDWVFWAAQEDIFEDQLAKELHDLVAKAKAIRIPKRREDCYLIEYRREHGDRFSGFSIVKAESPQDLRWTVREP